MDMLLYFVAMIGGTYQYDKPFFFGFLAAILAGGALILYVTRPKKAKH